LTSLRALTGSSSQCRTNTRFKGLNHNGMSDINRTNHIIVDMSLKSPTFLRRSLADEEALVRCGDPKTRKKRLNSLWFWPFLAESKRAEQRIEEFSHSSLDLIDQVKSLCAPETHQRKLQWHKAPSDPACSQGLLVRWSNRL
jgi:hypothetical protein